MLEEFFHFGTLNVMKAIQNFITRDEILISTTTQMTIYIPYETALLSGEGTGGILSHETVLM